MQSKNWEARGIVVEMIDALCAFGHSDTSRPRPDRFILRPMVRFPGLGERKMSATVEYRTTMRCDRISAAPSPCHNKR